MAETTDIFEVMGTMRAMRRLKPDPSAGRANQQDLAGSPVGAEWGQHPALAVFGGERPRDQEEGAGLL